MFVRALLALLSLAPIALVVFHVHQHGVNVPFWDEHRLSAFADESP